MKAKRILLGALSLLLAVHTTAATYYVNAGNPAPQPPFSGWSIAATNIQDALNLAGNGDTVLVTNGIYAYGGQVVVSGLLNRVALTNAVTVQSVNGPWVTTILGGGATNGAAAVRCAWLTNGASLIGFTLTAGATLTSGNTYSGESGGGAWCASSNALVANCVIVSNTAYEYGAGVYQGTVNNCFISTNANTISGLGGAAYKTVLNDCTIISNAMYGVASPLAMTNCIIYFNSPGNISGANSANSRCCTTPALTGTGNITNAPQLFADGIHLATNSPCIGAGVNTATGTDLFGQMWSNPPSIGCAEWNPAPVIYPQPAVQFLPTIGVVVGVNVDAQPPFACWWFMDGQLVQNNGHYVGATTPALLINNLNAADAGSYQIVVSNSFGMATSAVSQVVIHCVATAGSIPAAPYSDWTTAATNIQDAIDAAQAGDVVLVTNGVYAFGGEATAASTTTNRVTLNKAVLVESVNGPWVTTIQGGNVASGTAAAIRCAWLTNGAALNGFTLTGGGTWNFGDNGGGVCCASPSAFVANCLIVSNSAAQEGGGTYQGTLWNCAIYGNKGTEGGGTAYSDLNNCTVVGNSGSFGGAYNGGFTNCIIYYNSNSDVFAVSSISYCCSSQLFSGPGNFTNLPLLFVDDVHLFANSPCIGTGTNLGLGTDINGQPWGNPPSIGCTEAPTAPLVAQPVFQLTGNPAGFTASAAITGAGTLSCWWLFNGMPVQNNGQFSGAQTATLTVSGVSFADAGGYQLVVSNSFGVVTSTVAQPVIHCVNVNGANPVAPYTSWATAATNIQDAITAASVGDIVLVTNGVYATGGKSEDGVITNRVSVDKAILVQSVNGPNGTIIQGAWDPISTNGPGAVRGVWLGTNAILGGFTICGGATRAYSSSGQASYGGGIWGPRINLTPLAIAANCLIISNAASGYGGGAYQVNLNYCTIATNIVVGSGLGGYGGGTAWCDLRNCLVTANVAINPLSKSGGGGGAHYCYLTNCAVTRNSALGYGGGAYESTLVNCSVIGNLVGITGNGYGGGVANSTLANCIVYQNSDYAVAYENYSNSYSSTFSYSCTAPAVSGIGNIASDPLLLADGIHLSAASPCIGAGNASVVSGTDIDGQPWNNPPSMGCDEWQPAPIVVVQPVFQVGWPAHGLTVSVAIAGQAPFACFWTQNGTPIQDNGHYSNSGTASLTVNNFGPDDAGAYQVVVTNSSGSVTSTVVQLTIHTVNAAGANPAAPYSTWATAATNIQDAINAAAAGDIVLVTNGIYSFGGLVMNGNLTNRVTVNKVLTVTSVNGYAATVIQGAWDPTSINGPGAVRCAYLADGAVLNGFTLQNGATRATGDPYMGGPLESGGGIYCTSANGVAFNCVLSNNSAIYGGGLVNGTLNNSLVYGNHANYGGGAYSATLNNCTVLENYLPLGYSSEGAGTYSGYVRNSIVLGNYDFVPSSVDNYQLVSPQFVYCCTTPSPYGAGNINLDPLFLDSFHIASTSPCRGAGSPAYATGTDLDGEPWNNPPSIGCDEVVLTNLVGPLSVNIFTLSTNVILNWSYSYSAIITGRASWVNWTFGDGTVITNTGATVNHQWSNPGSYAVTCTVFNTDNPTGISVTIMVQVQPLNPPQIQPAGIVSGAFQFQFPAQMEVNYTIQYTTNLTPPVAWQTLETIYMNQSNSIQVKDSPATNGARFYRVLVQ